MNITFLVGNGFDIACGLHTSYKDFYKWLFNHQTNDIRVERLKNSLKDDINSNSNNWSDFELWFGQYTKHFNVDLSNEFVETYDGIHAVMTYFISEERKKYSENISQQEQIVELRNTLANLSSELDQVTGETINNLLNLQSENIYYHFITFNYTDCIDLTVKELAKVPVLEQATRNGTRRLAVKKDVIHVHGSTILYPIMGVSDESSVAEKSLLNIPEVAELILKERSVQSIGRFWYRDAKQCIDSSQIICIFGSSLGESDSYWWKEIVNHLKISGNHHVIIYWHTDYVSDTRSIAKRNREIRKIIDSLTCYSDLKPNEKRDVSNRIHVIFNSKKMLNVRLDIKE